MGCGRWGWPGWPPSSSASTARCWGSPCPPSRAWRGAGRVLAVCCETVAASTVTALVVEEVAPGQRGLAIAAITVLSGGGAGVTTVLYPLLAPNWRALYLLGGTGIAAAAVLAWLLPERRASAASM